MFAPTSLKLNRIANTAIFDESAAMARPDQMVAELPR
jgi:hypothetical protein